MAHVYWEPKDRAGKLLSGCFRTIIGRKLLLLTRRAEKQWDVEIYDGPSGKKIDSNGFNQRKQAADWALQRIGSFEPAQHTFGNYASHYDPKGSRREFTATVLEGGPTGPAKSRRMTHIVEPGARRTKVKP
jgi:hypothetical protein